MTMHCDVRVHVFVPGATIVRIPVIFMQEMQNNACHQAGRRANATDECSYATVADATIEAC